MAKSRKSKSSRVKRADKLKKLLKDTPRKKASRASHSHTTHKQRTAWFNAREAWPLREAPVELLLQARCDAANNILPLGIAGSWQQAGPTNVGGRMTSIAVNPADPTHIWVGAAGGGVWESADGGRSWQSRWHKEPSLNIGSLVVDPGNAHILYCGTGEANLSADSHAGVGVYRSMDSGATWHLLASAEMHGIPRRIGRIAINPFDPSHLMLAGVGHRAEDKRGLFVSCNGGLSWVAITQIVPAPFQCHDVVFDPEQAGTIYTLIDARGSQSGLWRSTDRGVSWTHIVAGLPSSFSWRRAALAIAPSDPKVHYLQISDSGGGVLGVFRSKNRGDTWTQISGSHFRNERQMTYNNTMSVDPQDADRVICGGVDLHLTKNGGSTWKKVTDWRAERNSDANYAHADQHALAQPVAQPGLIYALNDGGLDVSEDGGSTWENRSAGLATNMFYDLAVAASKENFYGGGLQDNGTVLSLDGDPGGFIEITGGDGGFCAIDPNDELHLFTTSQFMRLNRFRSSDGWAVNIGPNDPNPPWMAFVAMDPHRPKRIFLGSTRVWRSTQDGNASSWVDQSGELDGSHITCIEIARHDSDVVYVGTENGGIFRSDDGGLNWTGDISSSSMPGRTVTRLRTSPDDTDIVYATVANFGSSHLFRSTDGGFNWSDIDAGALPDVPFHGIAIPGANADVIFLASDAGVFVSNDAAGSWHNLTLNLPTVPVVDVVLHEASKTLYVATYGRSTWKLDVAALL